MFSDMVNLGNFAIRFDTGHVALLVKHKLVNSLLKHVGASIDGGKSINRHHQILWRKTTFNDSQTARRLGGVHRDRREGTGMENYHSVQASHCTSEYV
jgi:hypothetical protein